MATLIFAVFLAAAAATVGVRADDAVGPSAPDAVPTKIKVLHLKLVGDLDNARLAKEFAGVAADLRAEGTELVVLEVGANKWRADVLAEMVKSAREMGLAAAGDAQGRARWVVWLNDPDDQRVGSGPLALGVLADRCYVGAKVEVVHEPGDDVREIAPPPPAVDWEQIDQDLRAAVWGRLSQRGRDVLIAAAVPTPRQALWAVEPVTEGNEGNRLKVVDREPRAGNGTDGRATALVTRAPGGETSGLRLRMSAATLAGLGLTRGQAKELGQILAAEHVVARTVNRKTIVSGLAGARRRLTEDLASVDAAREKLDHSLDEAERAKGQDAARRRAKAGASGVTLADEAMTRLLGVESMTTEYPELLRVMPPGQTTVGSTEVRMAQAWVSAFQMRRQALADLRNRAGRLAEPPAPR